MPVCRVNVSCIRFFVCRVNVSFLRFRVSDSVDFCSESWPSRAIGWDLNNLDQFQGPNYGKISPLGLSRNMYVCSCALARLAVHLDHKRWLQGDSEYNLNNITDTAHPMHH